MDRKGKERRGGDGDVCRMECHVRIIIINEPRKMSAVISRGAYFTAKLQFYLGAGLVFPERTRNDHSSLIINLNCCPFRSSLLSTLLSMPFTELDDESCC